MIEYKSSLSEKFQKFLEHQTALGHNPKTYIYNLSKLDKYCLKEFPEETSLTEEIVLGWTVKDEKESRKTFLTRCRLIKNLGKFLKCIGEDAYIMSDNLGYEQRNFTPYMMTDQELHDLFFEIDHTVDNDTLVPYILSTSFRLIYTCGLRPNESRNLRRKDVNLSTGEIKICKTKNNKERMIVMSSDMLELAKNYILLRDISYPNSEYLFPDPNGNPYPSIWYQRHLTKTFSKIHPDTKKDDLPRIRVYDLRHRFASATLMNWINNGTDLHSRLPYLQTYMGHKNLFSTAYYIHLLPENLVRSAGINWEVLEAIIPEVSLWED